MRVAIVGGGFTGLAAGVDLIDEKIQPVIFEASGSVGGLAKGWREKSSRWSLEYFYHHIFTNDREIADLAEKVGARRLRLNPQTTSFFQSKETTLDSPLSLLKFPGLSLGERIRMGVGLMLLKCIPNGLFLEKYQATKMLPKWLGEKGYRVVWEKMLMAKFGPFVDEVNMAWFWSRVKKRTKKLEYFEGGFESLIDKTAEYIKKMGGEIRLNTPVKEIVEIEDGVRLNGEIFEAVIMTLPAPMVNKIFPKYQFPQLNYLNGQVLILKSSRKLIKGYWMNILENNFPFLVVVEHTNMIDKKYYGGKKIIYLGNYLPDGHRQLKMNQDQLFKLYFPYLKKINRKIQKKHLEIMALYRSPYAQPVFPVKAARILPGNKIGKRVFMANMSMVYPFDRGTNFAVKAGKQVAKTVIKQLK